MNILNRNEAEIRQVKAYVSRMCKIYRNIDFVIGHESYFTQEHCNIVGNNYFLLELHKRDTGERKISQERKILSEITRLVMF